MRRPQSLRSRARLLSFVLALPLSQCAVLGALSLPLSLRYALHVYVWEPICASVCCACACAMPAFGCVCLCVCECVRAVFGGCSLSSFFSFSFLFSLICVAALPNEKKDADERSRKHNFSAFFFIIIIYLFSVVQFKCRLHRRVYQFRHLLWNGK